MARTSELREVASFFLFSAMNINWFIWPNVYPYLASYLIFFDPSLTFRSVFLSTLISFSGFITGNIILPPLIKVFGVMNTLRLAGLLYFVNSVCLYKLKNIYLFYVNTHFSAAIFTVINVASVVFFSSKYRKQAVAKYSVALAGGVAGLLLWSVFANRIVNPDNDSMLALNLQTGELFFEFDISQRIETYLFWQGLVTFLTILLFSAGIVNPIRHPSKIGHYWKKLRQRRRPPPPPDAHTVDLNESADDGFLLFDEINMHRIRRNAASASDDNSLSIELFDNKSVRSYSTFKTMRTNNRSMIQKQISRDSLEDIKKKRFLVVFALSVVRFTSNLYYLQNFKYFGLLHLQSDNELTFVFVSVSTVSFLIRLCSPYLWAKIGFAKFYAIVFLCNLFVDGSLLFFANNQVVLLVSLCLVFAVSHVNYLLNRYTLFEFYSSEKSLHLNKYYELFMVVSALLMNIFNYGLTGTASFKSAIFAFGILDASGLILLLTVGMDFQKSKSR